MVTRSPSAAEATEGLTERRWRVGSLRLDAAGLATWLIPFVLVLYLALNNGGYDAIERDAIGIAVWWAVLVGTALSVLAVAGWARSGWVTLGLLTAFAAWTALSFIWTESDERTATELARVATYLGVLALALAVQERGRWRHLLHGVTAAVGIVCALAVLSRLEPAWFPERVTAEFLPGIEIERRLAYPLNYSSGLGAFAAIGLPLLLAAASSARTVAGQTLAGAALPVVALALWLTSSGLSVAAAAIGLGLFLVLAPDRLPKLGTLGAAGAGSAVLFAAADGREALDRGLPTAAAQQQGDEMLLIILGVCAGVAIAQAAIGRAVRHGRRPAWLRVSRERARLASVAALVAVVIVGVVAGAPGELSDRWDDFTARGGSSSPAGPRGAQLLDVSGSGRYQFWQSAADANATAPVEGIGPGTFEFWWSREGLYAGFVRDAHSLYMENLAELGIVGLLLIGGFSVAVLALGAWRALRTPPALRLAIAAATAGCGAFVAAAMVDWVWELGVLPVVFCLLAAIAVAGGAQGRRSGSRPTAGPAWRRHGGRIFMVVLSLGALVAISLPLAGAVETQRSRDAATEGRLDAALAHARNAAFVQPYAATPRLEEALILEYRGELAQAAEAAREATRRESTNWRTWAILSRIEERRGNVGMARDAYRKARSLNPGSAILTRP